jgi:RNA ligase (TIGR02306 family)
LNVEENGINNMSSLIVKISKITNIFPHPNADKLVIAVINDSWNCIVSKDMYKVGDLVIYCPPDCIIPKDLIDKYKLEFLKKNGRIGTIKLRGAVSQGLVLSIPEGKKCREGQEVSKELGITKYEPPVPTYQSSLNSKKSTRKHINRAFDVYTDIENIKHYPEVFTEEDSVVITEKIHGTSARACNLKKDPHNWFERLIVNITKNKSEFVYGSHRVQISANKNYKGFYGSDVYGKVCQKYNLAKILPEGYIFYFEIYGKGIQELEYGLTDLEMRVFDIKDVNLGKYLDWDTVRETCRLLNIPIVPILHYGKYSKEAVEKCTNGNSTVYLKGIREGCVIKPLIETIHNSIGRKILKSISAEYLANKNRTENH